MLQQNKVMLVYRNIGASECNQCCSRKATTITYSECMFVALGIQHKMRMRHVGHLWSLRRYSICQHYLIIGAIFEKENNEYGL